MAHHLSSGSLSTHSQSFTSAVSGFMKLRGESLQELDSTVSSAVVDSECTDTRRSVARTIVADRRRKYLMVVKLGSLGAVQGSAKTLEG
mmetsp:Transcript_18433/g.23202  ORF Transcript_18433/g.23202 Transcript_18433/m.23202 type:complete len:89 (-) Transcript_18433:95-361(-)